MSKYTRLCRLGILAAICGAVSGTILTGAARAGTNDGLSMQRFYELHQIDCARRWRDHEKNPAISMGGCIGFSKGMPPAAKVALAEEAKHPVPPAPKPSLRARYARAPAQAGRSALPVLDIPFRLAKTIASPLV